MKTGKLLQNTCTLRKLCISLAAGALVACGGGGSSGSLSGSGSALRGTAIDGYLQGSTVFLDVNRNGLLDSGEPSTTTDVTGRYTLDYSTVTNPIAGVPIVVTGGIDTDTGYAFTGRLSAQADMTASGQVVTPLTTLVDAMISYGLAKDAKDAKVLVATSLGLAVADLGIDPVAALANQPGIYSTAVELQRVVQLLASLNAQPGESAHQAQERVMKTFAEAIQAQKTPANIGQLVATLPLKNKAGAERLSYAVRDSVRASLSTGDHDSAKLALKGLDQVRLRMEADQDDDLDKAAGKLDTEKGLTTSKPFANLVKNGAGQTELAAISRVVGRSTVISQPTDTTGRLLASNCFQCHGTGGNGGFEKIRGNDASEVKKYLGKAANSDIMAAHAQGYTSAQLDTIIAYLKK